MSQTKKPGKPSEKTKKSLAQQQADFTAEGSPPPGHVAGTVPTPADAAPPARPVTAKKSATVGK